MLARASGGSKCPNRSVDGLNADRKDAMVQLDADLLKPSELARYLSVSRSWVYEAAKAGRIPCVRLGGPDGPLRFFRGDVERWLENARREWLPAESAASAGIRASRALASANPQLLLDGLADDRTRQ
jgi:excisionase family DNA binding protein